jgi:dolichol-phosphate mannosyltransferase
MKNIIAYFRANARLIAMFVLVSGTAVLLNLLLLYIMVQYLGMNTTVGENIANILSMEISIIYNFFLSRAITWKDRQKEHGLRLFVQILKFHAAIGITTLLRVVLFVFLQWLGVLYLINAGIGIFIAAFFNFLAYNRVVFQKRN